MNTLIYYNQIKYLLKTKYSFNIKKLIIFLCSNYDIIKIKTN